MVRLRKLAILRFAVLEQRFGSLGKRHLAAPTAGEASSSSISRRIAVHAAALLALTACSDDDGPRGDAGDGGSQSSAGSGGETLGAGGSSASGGSGGDVATYSVDEACARFASSACAKAVECGVVLDESAPAPVCLQCNIISVGLIASACTGELTAAPAAGDVDRCIDGISQTSCESACAGEPFAGCEAFSALAFTGALTCDPGCAQ